MISNAVHAIVLNATLSEVLKNFNFIFASSGMKYNKNTGKLNRHHRHLT